ncbi:MAG: amidohydrolase family protein [Pseudolabrys sp.]|nr:amidohydrolase family protein [Pseudolabrys sp.]MDP2294057.1 amidohydrolase family protein [Pseudolabrys sp.]
MVLKPDFPNGRRKPNFKLPPGATDAHCHVFGPGDTFPYAPNRRYTPEDAPKEMLRALHDFLGVGRAVIVQASCHGTDNAAMLDCIASDPKRYRGVAIVDDSFTDADYQRLHDGGVRGARFNFVKHLGGAPDMAVFDRVIDRIKGRGWHVVLHVDAPDVVPLSGMMRKLPLPFVIDHMGRVPSAAGIDQEPLRRLIELSRLENCWIKVCGAERISMPPYSAAVPIARILVEVNPSRVLWGTDFPHPNPTHECDEADLVDLVPHYAVDEQTQARLLVDNPARLYGFA